jgi:cell division transport system permease protein
MLPLVIAVMVYLAALSVAGFGAISNALTGWRADLASRLTVLVPARPQTSLDQRIDSALEVLRAAPAVAAARRLGDSELKALLAPWLGPDASLTDLPVPQLIDVTLAAGARIDADRLGDALARASPGAILEGNEDWVAQVASIGRTVQSGALGVIALVSLAGVAIVVFATRAGLSVHHENVEILHMMGAQDGFIAREFQKRYFRLGLVGGLLGLVLTGLSLLAAFHVLRHAQGPWLPRLVPGHDTVLVLLLLPIVAAILAMVTARLTVMRALSRMM